MGYDFNPRYEKSRAGDIKNSVADIRKAQEAFGYENEHDFNKELKETIKFYVEEFKKLILFFNYFLLLGDKPCFQRLEIF